MGRRMQRSRRIVDHLTMRAVLLVLLASGCGGGSNTAQGPPQPPPSQPPSESPLRASIWLTTEDEEIRLRCEEPVEFTSDSAGGADAITITVDDTIRYQVMTGFGAAMTDSAAWLIGTRMNDEQRGDLLRALFDPQEGIGLSYLRHTMGSADFSLLSYTYNDLPEGETDPDLSEFSIEYDREYILPVLREVLAINPDVRVMGTPWSAPAWMKTSNSLIGGSLRPDAYDVYARYFVRFILAFAAEGVPIESITPQNEPLHEASGYPSMLMSAAEQVEFIKNHLGPALVNAGLTTEIFIYDHNWDVPGYPMEVLNDLEARAYVAGTAFHCYAGDPDAQTLVHDAHPDKSIMITECTGLVTPAFGPDLIWAMQNLFIGGARSWATGVLLWNLALDENSGPQNGGCSICRGVVTVDQETGEVTYNPEYYALGHASIAARPGAYRIESSEIPGLASSVAFLNPDGSKGLLVLNPLQEPLTVNVIWNDQSFLYTLPAEAVATFTWP